MKRIKLVTFSGICVVFLYALSLVTTNSGPGVANAQRESLSGSSRSDVPSYSHRFPDFNRYYEPPHEEYDGPLFRLSQNYPTTQPDPDEQLSRIMKMPFGRENDAWHAYLLAVRDYCFEGNTSIEWQGQDNPVRKWYHIPWQHWGPDGREGIHGLTREATSSPQQLAPTQTEQYQTYAVGLYNPIGGYTIGNVWRDQNQPNPTVAKFGVGTVVCKILFTQAPPSSVPYLKNPLSWKAYADKSAADALTDAKEAPTKRSVQEVNLIQMDVMIRDGRVADTGGWIFGNFCYNGDRDNEDLWKNLTPVGIQWGDDPTVTNDPRDFTKDSAGMAIPFPPKTTFNEELEQTIINRGDELPPQHLGFGARLNGPVDYYNASCMSCHATAQYPAVAQMNPAFDPIMAKQPETQPGQPDWMHWFRNVHCGEPFSPGQAFSMDFSLQLAASLQNFVEWKSNSQEGHFTPYVPSEQGRLVAEAVPREATGRVKVHKIRRERRE